MERVRAIIKKGNKVLTIKRIKSDCTYWVIPGGGVEQGETIEQALVREGKEELGVDLAVKDLVTEIISGKVETEGQIEYFYNAEIIGGRLGTGGGPEYQVDGQYVGGYESEWIQINKLDEYDLRPEEIKKFIK